MNLSTKQQTYLKLMGIDVWVSRDTNTSLISDEVIADDQADFKSDKNFEIWSDLRQQVSVCTRCALHQGRTQTVFGTGNESADWLLIGEAPGAEEDKQGKPFVGRAGKLLSSMLQAIGLEREQVFITNILKCRPPKNRDPLAEEVSACEEYLERQIHLIKPRIILALGRIAAQNLLNTKTPIGKLRGKVYEYGDNKIPLIVTYHPAYLLRSPKEKRKSWQDLQMAVKIFNEVSI